MSPPADPELLREVLRVLVELGPRLDRLRSEGLASLGLTLPRVRALAAVVEAPRTSAELARELGLTPRAVTALVDGLVEAGLVERRPHPTDRRAAVVWPTARGRRVRRNLEDRSARFAADLAAGVPARDLAATLRTVQAVSAGLDRRTGPVG